MVCTDRALHSSPEPTMLLACGRNRELWEQPFWNNRGNNRILLIRFHAVCIYGACLKWLLPELSFPAAGQKDRRLWGREWAKHERAYAVFCACAGFCGLERRSSFRNSFQWGSCSNSLTIIAHNCVQEINLLFLKGERIFCLIGWTVHKCDLYSGLLLAYV